MTDLSLAANRRPITIEAFTAAIEAAVQERGPEFIYPKGEYGWRTLIGRPAGPSHDVTCLYVRTDADEPACIIGAALHQLGYPLAYLRRFEGDDGRDVLRMAIENVDERLVSAARAAQDHQDNGFTWGEALDVYRSVIADTLEVA